MVRHHLLAVAALMTFSSAGAAAAAPPTNWDGLAQVPAKNVDYLYLRPGADFSSYKAIILDPPEVSFRKNWQSEMNRSRRGLSRVSDSDLRHAIDEAQGKVRSSFEKKFSATGFQIVSAPAENALRVFVGIANIDVTAPEIDSPGRSRTYAEQAGHGTLVIEVRDSLSGELLGRAVDHDYAGDNFVMLRNSASNWADFENLFNDWATISANGFRKLVASSPAGGQ